MQWPLAVLVSGPIKCDLTEREADTRCKHGIRNAPYERRTPNPHSQEASSEGERLVSRRASSTNQAVAHFRKKRQRRNRLQNGLLTLWRDKGEGLLNFTSSSFCSIILVQLTAITVCQFDFLTESSLLSTHISFFGKRKFGQIYQG